MRALLVLLLAGCTISVPQQRQQSQQEQTQDQTAKQDQAQTASQSSEAKQGTMSQPIIIICNQALNGGASGDRSCMPPPGEHTANNAIKRKP